MIVQPSEVVYPPVPSRLPGRPKSKRYKGHDEKEEKKNQRKCAKCGAFGHNSRTCKGGPVAANKPPSKERESQPNKSNITISGPAVKKSKASTSKASTSKAKESSSVGGQTQTRSKTNANKKGKRVFKPPRQNYIP